MRDGPDDRPFNAEALVIMGASRVQDLKALCDDVAALFAELDEPEREKLHDLWFGPDD